ncbi:MAG: nuclear transport factor 2 family protein [Ramlibacter sp.]
MNADRRQAADRLVALFEGFSPADLGRLEGYYTPDALFKDPFNEVQGLPAIRRIYAHMFEALERPRFVVNSRVVDGDACFLEWEFRFAYRSFRRGETQLVRGGSHLLLAADGRILRHRDYWDAAEEVYEKLPVLGGLMRWLKKRAAT